MTNYDLKQLLEEGTVDLTADKMKNITIVAKERLKAEAKLHLLESIKECAMAGHYKMFEVLNDDEKEFLTFHKIMWKRVKEQVRVESSPELMPWGTYKMIILDPDGYRLGLIEVREN